MGPNGFEFDDSERMTTLKRIECQIIQLGISGASFFLILGQLGGIFLGLSYGVGTGLETTESASRRGGGGEFHARRQEAIRHTVGSKPFTSHS